jgi:hypothetical protein
MPRRVTASVGSELADEPAQTRGPNGRGEIWMPLLVGEREPRSCIRLLRWVVADEKGDLRPSKPGSPTFLEHMLDQRARESSPAMRGHGGDVFDGPEIVVRLMTHVNR